MAGIFPTRIEQTNDFSQKAGDRVLDILAKQPNETASYLNVINKVISDATKAEESQKLTEAVDAYNRAMEAGKSASEALKGLDPRMTGSKAFKDEADKIRASILSQRADDRAEAMWQNTLHRQALQDQANNLLADLYREEAELPGIAPIWIQKHLDILKQNPIAYNQIMSAFKDKDLSLPDASSPVLTSEALTSAMKSSDGDIQSQLTQAKNIKDEASNLGIVLNSNLEQAPYLKDLNALKEHEAKIRGLQKEDLRDFYRNIDDVFNQLSKDYAYLPQEQILASMQRHIRPSWWSIIPGFGRFAQDVVDDAVYTELQALGPNYSTKRDMAEKAEAVTKLLQPIVNNNTVKQEFLTARSMFDKIDNRVKNGLDPVYAQMLKAKIQSALISKISSFGYNAEDIERAAKFLPKPNQTRKNN